MREDPEDVLNNSDNGGFEFSFDCVESLSSPVPADQIFHNGKIKPIYDLPQVASNDVAVVKRKALRSLFTEERQHLESDQELATTETETETETSELDSVPSDTYCVWEPKKLTKVKSKNSSKRWKLKDLLTRSGSDRTNHSHVKINPTETNDDKVVKIEMKGGEGGVGSRRSYLPYRQELVGIFGSGRNLQRS